MAREYAVVVSRPYEQFSLEADLIFSVIFKDPEDLIWSTYLAEIPDRLTAMEIAGAMNEVSANN